MDSTRSLKVCCGIWHQDVGSRSFRSCKLWGGASMDWTCLSNTSHRSSTGLRSGEFGGQVNTSNSLLCSSNHLDHFCFVPWHIILLREAQPSGITVSIERVYMVCNNALVSGKCQSYSHTDGGSQGFPSRTLPKASHCLHRLAFLP